MWKLFWELLFWRMFFKFLDVFFKVKHSVRHISLMVGPIEVKWKGVASDGYWVNYVTLTFDLTYDLDLGFFKVKFENSCISGMVDVRWKESQSIRYWADCMVLALWPYPWIDLEVSRSKFDIGLFQEFEGKGMWVDHSWPWSLGYHVGLGRGTGEWLWWLQTSVCHWHI